MYKRRIPPGVEQVISPTSLAANSKVMIFEIPMTECMTIVL